MPDWLLGVIGVAVGVAVGWYWASFRTRPGMVKQLAETKVRGARAVEHIKQELAAELDRRERELAEVRNQLDQERQAAGRMQAEVKRALEQKARLDELAARLTERTESLGGELQTAVDESFREVGQFYEIGASLERAVEAFTRAVEAVESRLLVASRRMKELGITTGPTVAPAEPPGLAETPAPPAQPVVVDHPAEPAKIKPKH